MRPTCILVISTNHLPMICMSEHRFEWDIIYHYVLYAVTCVACIAQCVNFVFLLNVHLNNPVKNVSNIPKSI